MRRQSRGRTAVLASGLALVALLVALAVVNHGKIRARVMFWIRFERLPNNDQGYAEYRHRATGIVFVRVPGGSFLMGSPQSEIESVMADRLAAAKERPPEIPGQPFNLEKWEAETRKLLEASELQHEARVTGFLLAKYELTQEEWAQVMGELREGLERGERLPIQEVTLESCQEFCRRTGLRIPTEAQWEYACRGRTPTPFAFGDDLSPEDANFDSYRLAPVDSFRSNGFGFHNMHGNVEELCLDVFSRAFYGSAESRLTDPLCAAQDPWYLNAKESMRVARGGCLFSKTDECRSAHRGWTEGGSLNVGFRPAFYPLP